MNRQTATIRLHAHALARLEERGGTVAEVEEAVRAGEQFPAKYGRMGFRINRSYDDEWQGTRYKFKQVEAYAVEEPAGDVLIITVIVKFF